MKRLLNALQPADRSYHFFTRGSSTLVALSGGPDSLCLALVLRALTASRGLRFAAAHVNHGLRPEAGRDEAWVRRWCLRQGIEFFSVNVTAKLKGRAKFESVEEAARRVRYEALIDLAGRHGFRQLATAHTANDQAETVLMRLGTGSGLWGLAGIPAERVERGIRIIRPLLQVPKSELLAALEQKKIPYLKDRSNSSVRFLRNRIRARLLPELRRLLNPRLDEHLADLAADAAQWRGWSTAWAGAFIKKHGRRRGEQLVFDLKAIRRCPSPLRIPVYFLIAETLTGKEQHLKREQVRQIEQLVSGNAAGERHLACGVRVKRSEDRLGWSFSPAPRSAIMPRLKKNKELLNHVPS